MTARSFTEAFAAAAEPVDLDAVEARLADDQPDEHYILRLDVPALIAEVKRLRSVNDSTTGWAVTLEGQLARVQRIARDHREHVHEFCPAKRPGLTEEGFTVLCYLSDGHDGDCIFTEDDILGAALTGSTE